MLTLSLFTWTLITGYLLTPSTSIGIALTPLVPRCMIIYTDEPYETLKLQVHFPTIPEQSASEGYQIQLVHTETGETKTQGIVSGRYRKEIELDQDMVYKICLKMITYRKDVSALVEYSAEVEYYQSSANAKIPQNLLKEQETKEVYEKVMRIQERVDNYQQFLQNKKEQQNQHYVQAIKVTDRWVLITYIQIGLVLVAGLYQFWTIRKFLVQKNYM